MLYACMRFVFAQTNLTSDQFRQCHQNTSDDVQTTIRTRRAVDAVVHVLQRIRNASIHQHHRGFGAKMTAKHLNAICELGAQFLAPTRTHTATRTRIQIIVEFLATGVHCTSTHQHSNKAASLANNFVCTLDAHRIERARFRTSLPFNATQHKVKLCAHTHMLSNQLDGCCMRKPRPPLLRTSNHGISQTHKDSATSNIILRKPMNAVRNYNPDILLSLLTN